MAGQHLTEARQWQRLYPTEFDSVERDFIKTSQRRVYLRTAQIAAGLAILPLFILGFFLWSESQNFSTPKVGFYGLLAETGIYTLHPAMIPIPKDKGCIIEACEFLMGSPENAKDVDDYEKPQHKVRFNYRFAISETEVTFEQYEVFSYMIAKTGCKINDKTHQISDLDDFGYGRGQHPVINVNWDDAVCYTQWLSQQTGKHYRLPTEAEWEYAARAGTTTDFYWESNDPKDYAWFGENSNDKTQPVRQRMPNPWDLYDMSGNVWEWVQDCWHENNKEEPPVDGSAWLVANRGDCTQRVLRGGSWDDEPDNLRSATRARFGAVGRGSDVGFRLAQDLP